MLGVRSPGRLIIAFAYALVAVAVAIVITGVNMPAVGVSFTPSGGAIVARLSDGETVARLKPNDVVTIQSAAGRFSATAAELLADYEPTGSPQAIASWYQERDRLARVGRGMGASVDLGPDAVTRVRMLHPRPRSLLSLSADVWLLLGQGFVIGLLGVGVVALRPADWGARLFAVSCVGVLLAAFSGALFDARELTAPGMLLRVAQGINFIGSNLCATGILALFACQPRLLVPPWALLAAPALGVAAGVVSALGLAPLSWFYLGLLVPTLAACVVLALQWMRARRDPAARAILRWNAVTVFLGSSLLAAAMAAPPLLGTPSLGGDGMSFLPLFVVYGGVALGIARYRLFDLDRWSHRVLIGTAGALALLAADALLIWGLGLEGPAALSLSILLVANLYFPARAWLWRLIAGAPAVTETALLQSATEVAFTPDPHQRREAWRALLVRLFDPLDLSPSADGPATPEMIDDGVGLIMPATADERALVLRYRAKGRKLFDAAQVALASQLIGLMRTAEATRSEYSRGVEEERQRIARDLHDDVNARLLTSLHRTDVALVRADVRKAMSDIRTVISSLTGHQMTLDQVMADLRFETAERLRTADIALSWPLPERPFDALLLDHRICKALTSSHREVISNVLQHARAAAVWVSVEQQPASLKISVRDDGCGLPAGCGPPRGNGLRNIAERLGRIGGTYAMSPGAGGLRVDLTIPLIAPT